MNHNEKTIVQTASRLAELSSVDWSLFQTPASQRLRHRHKAAGRMMSMAMENDNTVAAGHFFNLNLVLARMSSANLKQIEETNVFLEDQIEARTNETLSVYRSMFDALDVDYSDIEEAWDQTTSYSERSDLFPRWASRYAESADPVLNTLIGTEYSAIQVLNYLWKLNLAAAHRLDSDDHCRVKSYLAAGMSDIASGIPYNFRDCLMLFNATKQILGWAQNKSEIRWTCLAAEVLMSMTLDDSYVSNYRHVDDIFKSLLVMENNAHKKWDPEDIELVESDSGLVSYLNDLLEDTQPLWSREYGKQVQDLNDEWASSASIMAGSDADLSKKIQARLSGKVTESGVSSLASDIVKIGMDGSEDKQELFLMNLVSYNEEVLNSARDFFAAQVNKTSYQSATDCCIEGIRNLYRTRPPEVPIMEVVKLFLKVSEVNSQLMKQMLSMVHMENAQ